MCCHRYIHFLFYILVVFLKKWVQIKNYIPIRNMGLAKYNAASQRC